MGVICGTEAQLPLSAGPNTKDRERPIQEPAWPMLLPSCSDPERARQGWGSQQSSSGAESGLWGPGALQVPCLVQIGLYTLESPVPRSHWTCPEHPMSLLCSYVLSTAISPKGKCGHRLGELRQSLPNERPAQYFLGLRL